MEEPLLSMEERGDMVNSQHETSTPMCDISEGSEGRQGSQGSGCSGRSVRSERSSVECLRADGVVPFAPDVDADVCLPLALTCSAAYAQVNAMFVSGLSALSASVGRARTYMPRPVLP